ncbi:MAG: amidase [Burkholderiales bacterium]|nr:amidase [Burkholderiales bacterium]
MTLADLNWLSAADAVQALREGSISAQMLTEACLARVRAVDDKVHAWAFLDPEHALAQARALDERRRQGAPVGPLHGLPVGIKDIIDTADMPTEDGTVLHAGRRPSADAAVVAMLRCAGAVIFGKTVTTELATYAPGKTRNPHNERHTPGGSSSGSAAAVAAGMVPLALGTQTNGSVIRPAAFCGVVGFKPTHGLVPRTGILRQSRALDTVGVMARSVADVACITECIAGYDAGDADTRPIARPPFVRIANDEPPLAPRLTFIRTPVWDRADAETVAAFEELAAHLGDRIEQHTLPAALGQAWDWQRTIMETDIASSMAAEYEHGAERLSQSLRQQIERGRRALAVDYLHALAQIPRLNQGFDEVFDRVDAIVTPAAPGTAPAGLDATGDPAFCTLWTLCGMPAITLPLLTGANGLPIGVQLVGKRGDDARLLRTARWLVTYLSGV